MVRLTGPVCSVLYRRILPRITIQGICSNKNHTLDNATFFSQTCKTLTPVRDKLKKGPNLQHFIQNACERGQLSSALNNLSEAEHIPYLSEIDISGNQRKVYFDVFGCQMNVSDTEVAWSVLKKHGFKRTTDIIDSDVILIMTCSIRENAEDKVWNRLQYYKYLKAVRHSLPHQGVIPPLKIGILGCMAERLKELVIEKQKAVDFVCGPDAYKDLPRLLALTESGQTAVNVLLSLDETYSDIVPVRLNSNSPSAFVSIMRGCDNMCSYCIVPFTRGRERSRPIKSILDEVSALSDQGIKEIILLGQNVNSYRDISELQMQGCDVSLLTTKTSRGFRTVYKPKVGGRRFAELLDRVSMIDPEMRIRFTSPHPKDFPDEVLHLMKERANICNHIHLPAQSGNDDVLQRMQRGYTRAAYLDLVNQIRYILPGVFLTSDFIAGFCGETEAAHKDSISLIEEVKYSFAFCFPYSMREKTRAHRRLKDDVPRGLKERRHMELVDAFRKISLDLNTNQIGQIQLVLIEGESKRSTDHFAARTEANTKVIIPQQTLPDVADSNVKKKMAVGDYVAVQVDNATSQTLIATPLYHTTLQGFTAHQGKSMKTNAQFNSC